MYSALLDPVKNRSFLAISRLVPVTVFICLRLVWTRVDVRGGGHNCICFTLYFSYPNSIGWIPNVSPLTDWVKRIDTNGRANKIEWNCLSNLVKCYIRTLRVVWNVETSNSISERTHWVLVLKCELKHVPIIRQNCIKYCGSLFHIRLHKRTSLCAFINPSAL